MNADRMRTIEKAELRGDHLFLLWSDGSRHQSAPTAPEQTLGDWRRHPGGERLKRGQVGAEGARTGAGQRSPGALSSAERSLAQRDVARLGQGREVLGQHRIRHPGHLAQLGKFGLGDLGQDGCDLQPSRWMQHHVERGGHAPAPLRSSAR